MTSPLAILSLVLTSFTAPAVEWETVEGCPGADSVFDAAEAFGASVRDATLSLRGVVEPLDGGGYRLDLAIETPTGTTTRQLRAASCTELSRAAGLVLSVAVDPLHIPPPPAPTQPSQPPVEHVGTTSVPPHEPPAPAPSPKPPPLSGSLFVAGTAGRGLTPVVDGRMRVGFALDARRVRAEASGFHAFGQDVTDAQQPNMGATIRAWGGAMRVGPQWVRPRVAVAWTSGLELAAVIGKGFGADRTWSRAALSWNAVTALGLRIPVGRRVSLGADGEFNIAVRRPAFSVATPQTLFRVPRVGIHGGLRLEVRFFGRPNDQNPRSRRPR